MEITLNNYEAFAIDYVDGKLDAIHTAKFILFLSENPEIQSEVEKLAEVILPSENIRYVAKGLLKKNNSPERMDIYELLVKKIENDLNWAEENSLRDLLHSKNGLQRELEWFGKTVVSPDLSIKFEGKQQLKKRRTNPVYWYAAAAMLIVAFISPFILKEHPGTRHAANFYAAQLRAKKDEIKTKNSDPIAVKPANRRTRREKTGLEKMKPLYIKRIERETGQPESLTARSLESQITSISNPIITENVEKYTGDIYLSPFELAVKKMKLSVADEENQAEMLADSKYRKIDLLEIAAKMYTSLSGKTTHVKKTYTETGEITSLAIISENFEYSKNR
jgi:hypothetical protein